LAEWVCSEPFYHLVVKAIRVDSHPPLKELAKALISYRLRNSVAMNILASNLKISLGTLKNWERGRIRPTRKSWPAIRKPFGP
jgi:hypothetical protein